MARSLSDGSALSPSSFPFSGWGSRAEPTLTRRPVVQTRDAVMPERGAASSPRSHRPSPRSPARGSELPLPSWGPAPHSAVPVLSTILTSPTGLHAPLSAPDKTPVLAAAPRSVGAPSRRQKPPLLLLPAPARPRSRRGAAPAAAAAGSAGPRSPRAPLPTRHLSCTPGKRVNKGCSTRARVHIYTLTA